MSNYAELLDGVMNAVITADVSQASEFITDKKDFGPEAQLAVYVDGYRIRLSQVVESAYPALLYAMGKDEFHRYVSRFIEATPSQRFNIDSYPIPFAAFVAHTSKSVFLHDLAMLESAIQEVYQAEESQPLARDWIDRQTPESLSASQFLPRKASRLLSFSYPVNGYLASYRAGRKPTRPSKTASYLLVFRHRHQVQRLALGEAEYTLFLLLASGKTLDNALEDAQFAPYLTAENLSQELMGWFMRWVAEGCLRHPDA